ncbi:DUF2671 domain-containing protein [Rickettsia endosymbiont of Halotydeus destructor]|uniref:DUF2671 domain-containing protein n=1 Tax=Rickettsia endosymbiont of Halotydeus destructor TaxID=2996754 RepID=UPI003BAF41D8
MKEKELSNNLLETNKDSLKNDDSPFFDVKYICQASSLITESIRRGFDVTQLPNGDVNVTEVRIVNVHYSWDSTKEKFIKTGQNEYNHIKKS